MGYSKARLSAGLRCPRPRGPESNRHLSAGQAVALPVELPRGRARGSPPLRREPQDALQATAGSDGTESDIRPRQRAGMTPAITRGRQRRCRLSGRRSFGKSTLGVSPLSGRAIRMARHPGRAALDVSGGKPAARDPELGSVSVRVERDERSERDGVAECREVGGKRVDGGPGRHGSVRGDRGQEDCERSHHGQDATRRHAKRIGIRLRECSGLHPDDARPDWVAASG